MSVITDGRSEKEICIGRLAPINHLIFHNENARITVYPVDKEMLTNDLK